MSVRLLIFDSHPVQYRVPVWKGLQKFESDLHVVYASDCSVRGHVDEGFGKTFSWDEPLLEGYNNTILNCENGKPLSGWGSLTGKGVRELIKKFEPSAILLTGLNYRYDLVAYTEALKHKIPLWLRCETQDEATVRSKVKSAIRLILYRIVYKGFDRFFFIGELNKRHYIKHKVPKHKLLPALYGTVDRFEDMKEAEKRKLRAITRTNASIPEKNFVIGFSGKLIDKKNPGILFEMLKNLNQDLRQRVHFYFVGSGELESELQLLAEKALEKFGVRSFFAGFVNQTQLPAHYLAMDILVLPSRKMGETWGLVANEAMQAGCGVIVSDAVGCGADFESWERFQIFKAGNPLALSYSVTKLAAFPRQFDWARQKLVCYSIPVTANIFAGEEES